MRTEKVKWRVWVVTAFLLPLLVAGMDSTALAYPPPWFEFFYMFPPRTIYFGDTFTIHGRIFGYYMPKSVELAYSFDESEWHRIATLPVKSHYVDPCGAPVMFFDFSHVWTPPKSGEYFVRGRFFINDVPYDQILSVAVYPVASGYADILQAATPQVGAAVKATTRNLRAGPGTWCGIVEQLHQGDELTIPGENKEVGNWLKVLAADGIDRWGTSQFVNLQVCLADMLMAQEPLPRPTQEDTEIDPTRIVLLGRKASVAGQFTTLAYPPPWSKFFYTSPPKTIYVGDMLTIYGRIFGYYMPKCVELAYSFDEIEWHQITTLQVKRRPVDPRGAPISFFDFSHVWTPPEPGRYYVRERFFIWDVPSDQILSVTVHPVGSCYEFLIWIPLVQSMVGQ